MSAPGRVVRAGVTRRRLQSVAMALTTALAVTSSVLAAALLAAARAPFDRAFAAQRGPHLAVQFEPRVGAARVAATAHLAGVTAAAGPYRLVLVNPRAGANASQVPVGDPLPAMTIAGRAGPGGPVDHLVMRAGRWATRPGEVVLNVTGAAPLAVGDHLSVPGRAKLTVVGWASSIGQSADAWVAPQEVARLAGPGTAPAYGMLYRFRRAATDAEMTADRSAIQAATPRGSIVAAASWLKLRAAADRTAATFVPFVVAFGVLGLVMSILVVGVVVSGAVGAATRRIGILKALGFTPAQVSGAYVAQALIPASVGAVVGAVLGNLLAIPAMGDAGSAFGAGRPGVPAWIDAAVAAGALAVVAATALVPALRAGRLPAVEAIAAGRPVRAGRAPSLGQALGRLPLPRAVGLGLAGVFARPARSATTAVAVAFGTVGVTFGLGLALSLDDIQDGLNRRTPGAVLVEAGGPPPHLPGRGAATTRRPTRRRIAAAIRAQAGTRRFFSTSETTLDVAGLAGPTTVIAYRGDSSWGAYPMLAGSWFDRRGGAVVPSGFLRLTGAHLGEVVTLVGDGGRTRVRIVGEAFDVRQEGMEILTDASSLAGLGARGSGSLRFDVDVAPGVDRDAYAAALDRRLEPLGAIAHRNAGRISATVVAMDSLAALLTGMLVAVAALGVLSTVVLDTRERAHDLGVLKALGMSPRQTVAMVIASVAGVGLVAAALGVPGGIALHHTVLPIMGNAAGTGLPAAYIAVYALPVVAALGLGGLAVAVAGALSPARWAARAPTAVALRSE